MLFTGSVYSKAREKINIIKDVIQSPNNDNIPVPNDNQEIVNMGSIKDNSDTMNEINQMEGNGFMVKGAGIKKMRNEKLKKFITLNI